MMVYVAFHRAGEIISNDKMYIPLQVGKKNNNTELNMPDDATGNNISDKNGIYSELTGWYWIWKNTKHDYVGTSHYRRYFTIEKPSPIHKIGEFFLFLAGQKLKRHGLFFVHSVRRWHYKILTEQQAESFMQQYDAVLPVKKKFPYTVYEQYKRRHNERDIIIVRQIISELQPDYLEAFDNTFASKEMYSFNMFIFKWKFFDEYMNWLFGILFELEKRSEINFDDNYQKRVCAFMAERLQTVWINKNNLKVKELFVLYFKKHKKEHLKGIRSNLNND
ncbi:MAG: DUF4422 domain-containing protein [Bacteroidales bacterium]|jgi:hypothetical protein|nr:DUF4422 domain-containing protein [Bacteroidales bacterium]